MICAGLWAAQGDDAHSLLLRMLPYLGTRRSARAREALELSGYTAHPDQLSIESAA